MLAELLKVLGLFLFSGTKFMMAPGAALAAGYSWWESILISFTGGVAGSIFFFKLGGNLFSYLERIWPKGNKKRKQFTAKNRLIIRLKNQFGVIGLAFLIPLISIPISALLSAKYFRVDKKAIPAYIIATAFWSIILTLFSEPVVVFVKSLLNEI